MFGKLEDLPLKDIQIIPFNLDQAVQTGNFAKIIFTENKTAQDKLKPRAIIPNDSKLFAQADLDKSVTQFITSDKRSNTTLSHLEKGVAPKFQIVNIQTPFNEVYGVLDL